MMDNFISKHLNIGKMIKPKAGFLIETMHEVANPIGGVYAVVSTKSEQMKKYYKDEFYAIGPYYSDYARVEFEEKSPPGDMEGIFNELKSRGMLCHYGTWLVPGKPQTILIDYKKRMGELKGIKSRVTKDYEIDCKRCGEELDKRIVWSDSVSKLLERLLYLPRFRDKRGVLHHHFSGPGLFLLDLKRMNEDIGLLATAHSTWLGRGIAMSNEDLVAECKNRLKMGRIVDEKREYKYGWRTVSEHQFEKTCANASDVFTAVSDITSRECRYILGRKADVVTPNGINVEKYPTIEGRAVLHRNSKDKVWKFLEAYFLPYYSIDVENSLLIFISGRYEFHTKGYDFFIKALGGLNKILKQEGYARNIFVFFFVRDREKRREDYEVLENVSRYEQIEDYIIEKFPEIEKRATSMLVHGEEIQKKTLFGSDFLMETKKLMIKFKKPGHRRPAISAVRVGRDDVIYKSLKDNELLNREEDRVKVIFYPRALAVGDGLISMTYYDAIAGMHLGVFPSYYEPWGYTPLETAAYSVPSITTDLAGFGKFVKKNTDQRMKPGVLVLRREGRGDEQVVQDLTGMLYWFSKLSRTIRVEKKLEAKDISNLADWKEFAKYYIKAHNMAIERCAKRVGKKR